MTKIKVIQKLKVLVSLALALFNAVKLGAVLPVKYISKMQDEDKMNRIKEKTDELKENASLYPKIDISCKYTGNLNKFVNRFRG